MSDKQDQQQDAPFSLNHFDEHVDERIDEEINKQRDDLQVSGEPLFDNDPFAEANVDAAGIDDQQPSFGIDIESKPARDGLFADELDEGNRFDETDDVRSNPEPIIPAQEECRPFDAPIDPEPELAPEPETPHIDPEPTPSTPLASDQMAEPVDDQPRSGISPIAMVAIFAILTAAVAAWLYPDASDQPQDGSTMQEAEPAFGSTIQIKRLQSRIDRLEQQLETQRKEYEQRIAELQQPGSREGSKRAESQPVAVTAPITATQQSRKPVQTVQPARVQPKPAAHTKPATHTKTVSGWSVVLLSLNSKAAADKALTKYKKRGISAEIVPAIVKGKQWYRLRVGGFANRDEAAAQKSYLSNKFGIKDAWLQKP